MRWLKRIAIGAGIYLVVLFGVAGSLVAFFHPDTPKALPSITGPFARMDLSGLPAIQRYRARDGALLSYRTYPGSGPQAVVLIHGSAGSSQDMHLMAKALEQTGATVIVPDLRGHGANFPHGTVAYVGQLDDDLADLTQTLQPAFQGKRKTLIGFSSGGGFVLRIAGGDQGADFDQFILLSPFLRYDAPTVRPPSPHPGDDVHWYSVSIPRIIGLSIFNSFGIHRFDGLPVLAFPVPRNLESVTPSYSFSMQKNFQPHDDYRADIRRVRRPMEVFVGGADDLFLPGQFAEVFGAQRHDIPVTILAGMNHSDMITQTLPIQAVMQAIGPAVGTIANPTTAPPPAP